MTQYATWASYSGDARTWLAVGLLAATVAAVLAGLRLPLPVQVTPPGSTGRAVTMAAWATSVMALLLCSGVYFGDAASDIQAAGLGRPTVKLTILPVTLTAAAILFVIILRRSPSFQSGAASAAIGAIAAPMIFELPFDPIVISRIHLAVPHPPPLILVYVPLVLTEITTLLLLLRLSPMVRLTRATFLSFALMLGVWAAWAALAGFGFPSAPLPIALNIASKLLAFVTAFTLFAHRRSAPGQAPRPEDSEQADPAAGSKRTQLPAAS